MGIQQKKNFFFSVREECDKLVYKRHVCIKFLFHKLLRLYPRFGAGAFLRYASITSFVVDFLANYGDLETAKMGAPKPALVLTDIEVIYVNELAFLITVMLFTCGRSRDLKEQADNEK